MNLKLIVGFSESNKVEPDYLKGELKCQLKKDITAPQLYTFLVENLRIYDELTIDFSTIKNLKFDKIDGTNLELIFSFLISFVCFVPFSLKSKSSEKKWNVSGMEDQSVSVLVQSFEFTRKLQETPPNILNTQEFSREAKEFLSTCPNVTTREILGDQLSKEGLNLIEAVGRASVNLPRLLIIEYKPNPSSKDFLALVGKGICYDTGGLNIKTGSYMSTMKFDMSGGAVSVGVISALSKNNCKRNVVVLVPLAENSISGNSYRPDDVIVSHSGKSIEIDNTDAEGRLVLADALSYAHKNYSPKEIISIATLTGAIGYALGYKYAGVFTYSNDQWNKFLLSSMEVGEWIWRMPMDEYYLKDLKSTRVADLKNSAKTGAGGASRAACFLREFVGDTPFIHLDIANVAHEDKGEISQAPLLRTLYHYIYSC